MLRSVIHFTGESLSCISPLSPTLFRHDEISLVMTKVFDAQVEYDGWFRPCLMKRELSYSSAEAVLAGCAGYWITGARGIAVAGSRTIRLGWWSQVNARRPGLSAVGERRVPR